MNHQTASKSKLVHKLSTNELSTNDFFAWDTKVVEGGDIIYGEVVAVLPAFDEGTDPVGNASGGYKVRLNCHCDVAHGTPNGVVDHFGFDHVATTELIRLSPAQMALSKAAGWPEQLCWIEALLALFPA